MALCCELSQTVQLSGCMLRCSTRGHTTGLLALFVTHSRSEHPIQIGQLTDFMLCCSSRVATQLLPAHL